jgi:hypothetical protein
VGKWKEGFEEKNLVRQGAPPGVWGRRSEERRGRGVNEGV